VVEPGSLSEAKRGRARGSLGEAKRHSEGTLPATGEESAPLQQAGEVGMFP
jgi:hypothetical protein